MADFSSAVEFVLAQEGGLHVDKHDAGGLTNFGISQRAYKALDIAKLTREDAIAIYQRDYWQFNGVHSQILANLLLSLAVNVGLHKAICITQAAMGVGVDGVWGVRTEHAANARPESIVDISVGALQYYVYLAGTSDAFPLRGWMRRVVTCLVEQ